MESQESFTLAHAFTAKWEGGLSDHPNDRGGITKYGVSIAFLSDLASANAGKSFLAGIGIAAPITRASILNLTRGQAEACFRHEFWEPLLLDKLPLRQAVILYDAAVNSGRKQAVKLSQRGYNQVATGTILVADGIMGPLTRAALNQDTDRLVKACIEQRRNFFHSLVSNNPSQVVFLKGWLNRANDLEKYVLSLGTGGR